MCVCGAAAAWKSFLGINEAQAARHHIGLLSWRVIGGRECGRSGAEHGSKLVNGSRVGQVGPVDSCGQVGDLDPSLVNSRNLSRVGQVRPVDSCGQVGDLDPSLVKSRNLSRVGQVRPADSCGQVRNIDPSRSK